MKLTLPTDSKVRKDVPLYSGCYAYFPAALAGVAMHSKMGNDKHNPGEPLHHSRGKSSDHADCIARHSMDIADMLARRVVWTEDEKKVILTESRALSWRALAWAQEIEEMFGAPLAPAARLPKTNPAKNLDAVDRAILDQRPEWVEVVPETIAERSPVAILTDYPPPADPVSLCAREGAVRLTSRPEKSQVYAADLQSGDGRPYRP